MVCTRRQLGDIYNAQDKPRKTLMWRAFGYNNSNAFKAFVSVETYLDTEIPRQMQGILVELLPSLCEGTVKCSHSLRDMTSLLREIVDNSTNCSLEQLVEAKQQVGATLRVLD